MSSSLSSLSSSSSSSANDEMVVSKRESGVLLFIRYSILCTKKRPLNFFYYFTNPKTHTREKKRVKRICSLTLFDETQQKEHADILICDATFFVVGL